MEITVTGPISADPLVADPVVVDSRLSAPMRLAILATVILPLLGFIAAVVLLWGPGFGWIHLALVAGLYVATAGGVTLGFHRLFTHRSYETIKPIRVLVGICGSMAVEGPLLKWVAMHRRHHQLSDQTGDPHSPHLYGKGLGGLFKGIWHSHVGWLFDKEPIGLDRYVRDLQADPAIRKVSDLFPLWVLLGLTLPAVIAGLVTMSWWGAFLGFMWGGLARVFLVHHITWSINSVCHIWGKQDFRSQDESRNNPIFGILSLGEGWHNNHHAFPTSARHGLFWWQFDATWIVIRILSMLGLAWDVRLPSAEAMATRRVQSAAC